MLLRAQLLTVRGTQIRNVSAAVHSPRLFDVLARVGFKIEGDSDVILFGVEYVFVRSTLLSDTVLCVLQEQGLLLMLAAAFGVPVAVSIGYRNFWIIKINVLSVKLNGL